VLLMIAFLLIIRLLFHRTLHAIPRMAGTRALTTAGTITDRRLLITSLVVVGIVLVGFITEPLTGFQPSVVALMGAGLLLLLTKLERGKVFAEVEWETLLFFAGLFIMIGSLVNVGVIAAIGRGATSLMGEDFFGGSTLLLVGSGVISGIVDNIPYVATLAPMTDHLVSAGGPAAQPLWWALAMGAALGGNATAIGASSYGLMLGIAKRHGHEISFWQFTRYGLVVTAVMIALCIPYLWLRYFL
jgi:Na+/H+ antiporter NhaD/arsenite permease-like protein